MSFFINRPFFQYNIKHLIFVCVNIHIAGGIRSGVHRYTSVEECACAHVEARGHLWGVVPWELTAMFSDTRSLTRT